MSRLPLRLLALGVLGLLAGCALRQEALRPSALPAQARTDAGRFLVITVRNDLEPILAAPGSTPRGYAAAGTYGASPTARAIAHSIERDYGLRQVSAWPIESLRVHCVVVRMPHRAPRSALIARLERDSRVQSVQPLNEFTTDTASRSYLPLQLNLAELGVLKAHRLSQGASVRIAIIDTGVDYRHPDLRGRVITRRDFVSDARHDFRGDRHGTAVAGVIAATASGGRGVLGIAPESRLIALKACWPLRQGGAEAACDTFTLAQALQAAITARADIVNLSLAGPPDPLLARLIRYGIRQGILYVAAVPPAKSGLTEAFPADMPGVLGVQSSEDAAEGSSHLLAPGRGILTLVPGGHYDFASGSSLATAEVTGIAALILADGRRLPAARVQQILAQSSRQFATPAGPLTSVNACAALADALARTTCGPAHEVSRERRDTPSPPSRSEEAVKLNEEEPRALRRNPGRAVVVAHSRP